MLQAADSDEDGLISYDQMATALRLAAPDINVSARSHKRVHYVPACCRLREDKGVITSGHMGPIQLLYSSEAGEIHITQGTLRHACGDPWLILGC
jgi:hypothetical protein